MRSTCHIQMLLRECLKRCPLFLSVGQSGSVVQPGISKKINYWNHCGSICVDIHGLQRMTHKDFCDDIFLWCHQQEMKT